jgi:hypothetical protein
LGHNALQQNLGEYNVGIGRRALYTNTTGTNNTAIGSGADVSSNNLSNATAIGYNASVTASNTIQLGNTDVTSVRTSGALTVVGITNNGTLTNNGNATITGTLGVTGNTTITGTLTVSGNTYPNSLGTNGQVLTVSGTTGTLVFSDIAIRQISEQFKNPGSATNKSFSAGATSFSLTQTPSSNAKVLMFINGVRVDNDAYSWSGNTLTYIPANNGTYALLSTDRIQFDYFY